MDEAARVLRDQLRVAMANSDMSQLEFGRRSGLGQGHVSSILSGTRGMGRRSLGAVLLVFPNLRPAVVAVLIARRGKAA